MKWIYWPILTRVRALPRAHSQVSIYMDDMDDNRNDTVVVFLKVMDELPVTIDL